jgi:hypothetical protein
MVENYYDTFFEMYFNITFCSGSKNTLANILLCLVGPYNMLVKSGGGKKCFIKNHVDKKNLIKDIDYKS